jgi:small subunit ribosomal protein S35
MATAARALSRSALLLSRRSPAARKPTCQCRFALPPSRLFSATSFPQARDGGGSSRDGNREEPFVLPPYSHELFDAEERSMYDLMSPEDREIFDNNSHAIANDFANPESRQGMISEINQTVYEIDKEIPLPFNDIKPKNLGFWGEDEEDEFAIVEDDDDEFHNDDISSIAHAELEQHREIREYARIAAWDMPLLSSKTYLRFDTAIRRNTLLTFTVLRNDRTRQTLFSTRGR